MLVKDALFRAERVEEVAAEIYDLLARKFAANAEASELFEQLAREERQHGRRVQMLRVRIFEDADAFSSVHVDVEGMRALEAEGRAIRKRLEAASDLDLGAVKIEMANLERRFAAAHVDAIADIQDASVRELFERLASHDRAHVELLIQAAESVRP